MSEEKKRVGDLLALYKAGENTAALWLFKKKILVDVNFRAHGHGEMNLVAKVIGGKWVDLVSGMNCDFGRACDRAVQKMMQTPTKPLLVELAEEFKVELKDEDVALDFQNGFSQYLLDVHYEGVVADVSKVSEWIRKSLDIYPTQEMRDGVIISSIVMEGPDYFRYEARLCDYENDEGLIPAVRAAVKEFLGEFQRDAGLDEEEEVVVKNEVVPDEPSFDQYHPNVDVCTSACEAATSGFTYSKDGNKEMALKKFKDALSFLKKDVVVHADDRDRAVEYVNQMADLAGIDLEGVSDE